MDPFEFIFDENDGPIYLRDEWLEAFFKVTPSELQKYAQTFEWDNKQLKYYDSCNPIGKKERFKVGIREIREKTVALDKRLHDSIRKKKESLLTSHEYKGPYYQEDRDRYFCKTKDENGKWKIIYGKRGGTKDELKEQFYDYCLALEGITLRETPTDPSELNLIEFFDQVYALNKLHHSAERGPTLNKEEQGIKKLFKISENAPLLKKNFCKLTDKEVRSIIYNYYRSKNKEYLDKCEEFLNGGQEAKANIDSFKKKHHKLFHVKMNNLYKEYQNVISKMSEICVSKGITPSFQMDKVKKLLEADKKEYIWKEPITNKVDAFSDSDVKKIFKHIDHVLDSKTAKDSQKTVYAALALNFFMGLRIGELCALHKDDVDDEFIHVQRTVERLKGTKEISKIDKNGNEVTITKEIQKQVVANNTTKTESGKRSIPIWNEDMNKYLDALRKLNPDSVYLVSKGKDSFYTTTAISNSFRQICKDVGIKNISGTHAIRKTLASILARDPNVPSVTIISILGHSAYQTTQRFYERNTADIEQIKQQLKKVSYYA